MTELLSFSLLEQANGKPATKVYFDPSMKPAFYGFGVGSATTQKLNISDFAQMLTSLKSNQCMVFGVARNGQQHNQVTVKDDTQGIVNGKVARSRTHFAWPDGAGVWFIDIDGAFTDQAVSELPDHLTRCMPELRDVPMVITRSSSHGITIDGKKKNGGVHIYVAVNKATAIPQLTESLYIRLFIAGHGYHVMNASKIRPAALERNLIDKSVSQPERIDFAADPVISHPAITRQSFQPLVLNANAAPMQTDQITPLSDFERQQYKVMADMSKARVKPDIRKAKAKLLRTKPKSERKQLHKAMTAADDGKLTGYVEIVLADGSSISVSDILNNPEKYHGQPCRDPLEPDYRDGAITAIIYSNQKTPVIHSQAHGGQSFRLLITPTNKEVITACYKKRALQLAGGIHAVAGDLHTTPELVKNVFLRHLQQKSQPFHQAAKPTLTFATIEQGYQYLQNKTVNALVQAPLGSGKTQHIATPLVKSALQNGQKVISLTVLRSLTRQNANNMGLGHYQDTNANQRQGISATIHSLAGDKVKTLKDNMLKQPGLIIVDEGAMVAALTLNTDSILSGSEKKATLDFLRSASTSGSRIIFLDADVTPMLRQLVYLIAPSAELIKITGQQYAPPKLNLIVEQSILAESGSKPKNTNGLGMAIAAALADGKKVAVACLTKAEAQAIHAAYGTNIKSIVLHSENTGEPEQAELLADPEQHSEQYDLITYSPVLGAGFSVTGHERVLFASFSYATLHPTGMMQIIRRFRRAAGSVITIGIDPSLQKPQKHFVGAECAVNEVISDAGAHAFEDPFVAGAVIAFQTDQLAASNPFHAFVGHALNQGFEIDFIYPTSLSGTDEKIAAKKAVKEDEIQSIMDVQTPDAIEYERLKAAPATDKTSAPVKRYEIETALCIGVGESDLLTEEVVDGALNQRLVERTDKAALLAAVEQGATFTESPEAALSFAFKKHTQKQVELMQEIVRMITNDAGVISITGSDALRVADAMRGKIRHFHNLLNAPKRQNLSKSVHIAWLRGLLGCWGFVSVHKERVGDGSKGADQYQYTYDIDAILTPFVHRKAAIYVDAQKRLKPAWIEGFSL